MRFPAGPRHYGLSLALGSAEVTMQEEAALYAMLSGKGLWRPLRLTQQDPLTPGKPLLSPEAAFMVMDILSHNPPPPESGTRIPVAWKTGTSWGFHDAWTTGRFGPYVLVVWIGNSNGAAGPSFIGARAAAPLFFRIIDALQAERIPLPIQHDPPPAGLRRIDICLASGNLPTPWCPRRGKTWFIPGKSPIRVDTVFRPLVISDRTGLQACPPYTGKATHTEIFEFWPSDLQHVFEQAGIPLRHPPGHELCDENGTAPSGEPPVIRSPSQGATYTLRLSGKSPDMVPFSATTDASVHRLYWFVNNALEGSSPPGGTFWWHPATFGKARIRVVTDTGQEASRVITLTQEP
ncbi:hypothetical protein LOC54_04400 [Acetobacter sp. AN02]|uniref:hypothetical protein n=1 Tax=Acetobacter sp. AN02 TaxID=2894186 RepID=UPI002434232C|nr:hypothetical protein [Acetobacter sp. AN02]MDG6094358.1 hypothetical protein [Acetobacter sp. AN02]